MYLLCKKISEEKDVKVLLSGEISDELFGYKYTAIEQTKEESNPPLSRKPIGASLCNRFNTAPQMFDMLDGEFAMVCYIKESDEWIAARD